MDHAEVLNQILGNECLSQSPRGPFRLFTLSMHCNTAYIVVKLKPQTEIEYEILFFELSGIDYDYHDPAYVRAREFYQAQEM